MKQPQTVSEQLAEVQRGLDALRAMSPAARQTQADYETYLLKRKRILEAAGQAPPKEA